MMAWTIFAERTLGESHVRAGLPCQDYTLCTTLDNNVSLIVVADGHGSRRHFRSDKGSQFACEEAIQQVRNFYSCNSVSEVPTEDKICNLKQSIITAWRKRVKQDVSENIWSIDELEEQSSLLSDEQYSMLLSGESSFIPYGSTVVICFITKYYWCGLQLGDGGIVKISEDGSYIWPLPESEINVGSKTASLCMNNPMPEFRHFVGIESPVALLAYSDGIEKSFPYHSMELASYLHRILRVVFSGDPNYKNGIQFGIQKVANTGRVRDDVSIAGIVDISKSNPEPQITEDQRKTIITRIMSLLKECEGTIDYYKARIEETIVSSDDSLEIIAQMEEIVEKKEIERLNLLSEISRIEGVDEDNNSLSETVHQKQNEKEIHISSKSDVFESKVAQTIESDEQSASSMNQDDSMEAKVNDDEVGPQSNAGSDDDMRLFDKLH